MLVRFQSGLLPRGLFCSLIVELLQSQSDEWRPHLSREGTYHTFSNLITFNLPNAYSLSLFDKMSYLEVQLRHPQGGIQLSVHNKIYLKLVQALIQTCNHLEFEQSRLQYGFLCDCGTTSENHIAVIPVVTQSLLFADCSISTVHHVKLCASHLIWIMKDYAILPNNGNVQLNMTI